MITYEDRLLNSEFFEIFFVIILVLLPITFVEKYVIVLILVM